MTVYSNCCYYAILGVQYSSMVSDELTPLHEKWYDLGVKLQIDRKVLDGIKKHNYSASYLNHVVMEWLKLNSNLSCLPTWNHLIKAIALMNEEEEAKVLQQSHPVTRDITRGMEHILCDNWDNVYGCTYECLSARGTHM